MIGSNFKVCLNNVGLILAKVIEEVIFFIAKRRKTLNLVFKK